MLLKELSTTFSELFNQVPEASFFAPGRVNLIGEHIDYNGGLVFPCAITKGTYAVVMPREDATFHVYSKNFKEVGVRIIEPNNLVYDEADNWANYLKGVLSVLVNKGFKIPFGFNMVIFGDLPNGAGLSSSASLEMLFCHIFNTYYHLELSPVQMALIGKQVENEFMGVNSGIMDQFAIALGQKDAALLLNCSTQEYEQVPFSLNDYTLVIMNTNKRRTLADSKYNERFSQCQAALQILKKHYNIDYLCDLSSTELPTIEKHLADSVLYKRTKHAITENERVIAATKALACHDLVAFGRLLTASHESLKEDYEVTGMELDTLVASSLDSGALGARMTGAGFGGCAIALVKKSKSQLLIKEVSAYYKTKIGYEASFYEAAISNGPIQCFNA